MGVVLMVIEVFFLELNTSADVAANTKMPLAPTKKAATGTGTKPPAFVADSIDAERIGEVATAAKSKPAELSATQLAGLARKKATCPFMGAAVSTQALCVRNSADKPLANIQDVVALGNSGGGNLGELLKVFATGNHAKMVGPSGDLDAPVPAGLFSLDFPGSQGSHPGHSGILQGDPTQLDSGRFSQPDLDRLLARAKNGQLKRSDIGKFIAENLANDPHAKVLDTKVAGLLFGDLHGFVKSTGPALLQKLKNTVHGTTNTDAERRVVEALTKNLGEDNLVGSAGEFGLLMAFLANSPRTQKIDGEPAVSVEDVKAMFQDYRFPDGWEKWPKTRHDWVTNTTALMLDAGKQFEKLKAGTAKS